MCIPIAAAGMALSAFETAGLAISAGTAVAQNYAQRKAGEAQAEALNQGYEAQLGQVAEQQKQIGQAGEEKKSEIARQALIEQAKLFTAAGEQGVAGGGLDRLSTELQLHSESAMSSVANNTANQLKQSDLGARGLRAQTKSQINAIDMGPGALGTGLQILGAGASAFSRGTKLTGTKAGYTGKL